MLSKIIAFSIRNKLIVGLMVIALTAYGVYNLTKLPIDAVPDITNNQVQINTIAPALSPTAVTFPGSVQPSAEWRFEPGDAVVLSWDPAHAFGLDGQQDAAAGDDAV